jgi:uncharacterized surface protein with fasciclin (FAS1) repeats
VWDAIVADPDLSDFRAAVEDAELVALLDGAGPLTVLAPDNDAFDEAFPDGVPSDQDELRDLVERHIVNQTLSFAQIFALPVLETEGGDVIQVFANTQTLGAEGDAGARIVDPNISGSNGMVQVLDAVIPTPD